MKNLRCRACGAPIKIEDKNCSECGVENAIRNETIKKLEDSERKVEENLAKMKQKDSKKRETLKKDTLHELDYDRLVTKLAKVRVRKMKLITGDTHEGKLDWIKTQYFDLQRSIKDIAGDLGESSIAVRKYLDEIENQADYK